MESYSRIRSVKLKRPTADHPFGFSVRGGHEHGTGIFVSFVDPRSIAYRQGLKVGDQILRVNGFPVSAAVHHECLSLMRIRTGLHLKVRSVGMLPVKEKTGDPLTWKLVEEQPRSLPELPDESSQTSHCNGTNGHSNGGGMSLPNNRHTIVTSRMSDTSSQPDSRTEFLGVETKVFIDITGQSGLGCCICKGPPERPGIFVQSTKSNGVAREAGLRPGDQVISCNGHSFMHIPFAEAVYYLKSSKHLNLRVIKGVASDLFPGESSGYNSSASSLNGDAHGSNAPSESSATPSPADIIVHDHEQPNKRLSMVTEENQALHEESSSPDPGSPRRKNLALDRNMEWDEVEQVWRKAEKETIVIEVKGQNPVEKLRSEEERLQEERRKLEETQRRLQEETERLEEEKRKFEEEKRRSSLRKSPSVISASSTSTESANSLAGALTQEILKRKERESNPPAKEDERPKPGTVEQKRSIFSGQIDQEKRQQHEQLIEEFKRAHRKMFAHTLAEESSKEGAGSDSKDGGNEAVRNRRVQKAIDHERQMVAQRVAGIVRQRQLRIERQHQEVAETEREVTQHVTRSKTPPPPPPMPASDFSNIVPPPPMPNPKIMKAPPIPAVASLPGKPVIIEEKSSSGSRQEGQQIPTRSKCQAPPPPPPQRSLGDVITTNGMKPPGCSSSTNQGNLKQPGSNGSSSHIKHHVNQTESSKTSNEQLAERPESPSPDYSNSPSPTPSPPRKPKHVGVDMQSLESFRLRDPPRGSRKPPPVYFCDATQQYVHANGSSAKMSAYSSAVPYSRGNGSGQGRPGVGKLVEPPSVPIGSKGGSDLQKELENALARCNLTPTEISGNGQGKVTIVLEESYNNNSSHCHQQNNRSNGMKPNGGILKVSNGHHNGGGNNTTPKTISFGGKY